MDFPIQLFAWAKQIKYYVSPNRYVGGVIRAGCGGNYRRILYDLHRSLYYRNIVLHIYFFFVILLVCVTTRSYKLITLKLKCILASQYQIEVKAAET